MSGMHLYSMGKGGDPLCPLGFHPQVRWPTRCKRCFRDYKEHGGKRREPDLRKDDVTASTPSLGTLSGQNMSRRSWASSTNLTGEKKDTNEVTFKNPSSWTSTPDLANLEDDTHANIPTVSLTLPLRRKVSLDTGQFKGDNAKVQSTQKHKPASADKHVTPKTEKSSTVFNKSDSLATRAKKLQALKEERPKRLHIKEIKASDDESTDNDVQFLIQVKSKSRDDHSYKSDDDSLSTAGTDTTETTTLVDPNEFDLKQQLESLKEELKTSKSKCERLEKEKSNILLRRLTAMDTTKGNSSEVLKLQQRVNELQGQLDDYKDEKKVLNLRVKELEDDLENRPTPQATQKIIDELRSKVLAAETLCEELMDENEDMKKELRDLEDEMEEMQDNFREDQADEYTSLKKELEQTTKNCRILSFKLRKTERKTEQLEQEKAEADKKLKELTGGSSLQYIEKIKQLEKDLQLANDASSSLQRKLDETNLKLSKAEETKFSTLPKRKAPMLGSLGKSASTDMKVSRESLTRGGSQDDPVQLLRDLQDSLEREADLREQLKFAEEEGETLRKKVSRIEEDNESLALQLKKMATRTRTRKSVIKGGDEKGDEEDPSDVKLQLELSEQESSVLRKKVEEMEEENTRLKKKAKDLQDKLTAKPPDRRVLLKGDKDSSQNDKIKALENEMNEIRKKLIEKERDCERLEAEVNLSKKRSKEMTRSKSQELDQQTVDLKRQLQVIEQEASVFRSKAQALEVENEKLMTENKRLELARGAKGKGSDVYIDKIATLEVELETANKKVKELEDKTAKPNGDVVPAKQVKLVERERDKLQVLLDKLKESSAGAFKNRKAKAPTELTTKAQLRTMVTDLENEIGAMLITLETTESSKKKLQEELQKSSKNSKGSKDSTNKELEDLTKKLESAEKELKLSKAKVEELNKKLGDGKDDLDKERKTVDKLTSERNKLEDEVAKLKSEGLSAKTIKSELSDVKEKYNTLSKSLEKKEADNKKLKDDLEERNKLAKELMQKTKLANDLQKRVKELEDESKKSLASNKEKIKKLEESVEQERKNLAEKVTQQSEISESWGKRVEKLTSESRSLNNKISELEDVISEKNSNIAKLEKELEKEKAATTSVVIKGETKEAKSLREELAKLKVELKDSESKANSAEKATKQIEERLKKAEAELKTEKSGLEKKVSELDQELQGEKKKVQLMKSNMEKEQKNREMELSSLKTKIKSLETSTVGGGSKKVAEVRQEYQEKIDKLQSQIDKEKKEYETLTAKYEVLEEEHVVTKAKLVTEKEALSSQLVGLKREVERIEEEADADKKNLMAKLATLEKEKTALTDKMKNGNSDNLEKARLKVQLEDRQTDLDQLKKEHEAMHDQIEYMRRENDELRKKLEDYEKVSKVQRSISADSSAMDKEIRELKQKVLNIEKTKKADQSELKMRYEGQLNILNEEMQSLQGQVSRFKRERDNYKHMFESAQKTIGDLKSGPVKTKEGKGSAQNYDEVEEFKNKIATLEQQVSCMEDELSESRLEASKLKTELVSERSSWEVKMSEMHSRVNELEEDRLLSSGRSKIVGLKTRMELSWQKEREEQQRLLQETATLARDLRQTLFEVERERDKDILEAKRKMDQLKKTLEEEQDENKKKLTELQCDLMELRDAHAKLRTTNEKLRREKERQEKEREEMKLLVSGRRRSELEDYRRVNILVQQVENLLQLAPELFGTRERDPSTYTPTPPKRTKSKSREGSPAMERRDFSRESSIIREEKRNQVQSTLQRLVDATDELKRIQRVGEEDRERSKRPSGIRRATSTENDQITSSHGRKLQRNDSNLYRKSLSLEHTASMQDNNIWKGDDGSMSSLQSFDSDVDFRWKRDASMDSRLSGGSTQSEVVSGEKRKKKGLMGKLKKLTKSKSIDDDGDDHFKALSSKQSSVSDIDDSKGSKKDLKEKITGIFKRAGSSSRSNSVERQETRTSTQRPLMRNGSTSRDSSIDRSRTIKRS